MFFHLFGNSAHELTPGVDLQHFRPFQWPALVDLQKSLRDLIRVFRGQGFGLFVAAGHVSDGQSILENFSPAREFVMRPKKKVSLVHLVGHGHIKFRPWNVLRWGKIDLPKRLLHHPLFCGVLGDLGRLGQLFDRGEAFPVATGAVVNLSELALRIFMAATVQCLLTSSDGGEGSPDGGVGPGPQGLTENEKRRSPGQGSQRPKKPAHLFSAAHSAGRNRKTWAL